MKKMKNDFTRKVLYVRTKVCRKTWICTIFTLPSRYIFSNYTTLNTCTNTIFILSDPIVTVTTKGINIHLQDLNKTYRLESDIDNNGNLKKWKNIIDNSRTSSRNIIRDNNNTINNIIKTTERWRRGMTTINDYCE